MFARILLSSGLLLVLIGGAPAVPPLPEVGFWVVGPTPVRKASNRRAVIVEFADGTRGSFEPGDDILGWTLVDIRRKVDHPAAGTYVLLSPPDGNSMLELWPHIQPDPRPNVPRWHVKWKDWLHHSNQLDAIRYRAQGLIIVVGKPNGEPDDPGPLRPFIG